MAWDYILLPLKIKLRKQNAVFYDNDAYPRAHNGYMAPFVNHNQSSKH